MALSHLMPQGKDPLMTSQLKIPELSSKLCELEVLVVGMQEAVALNAKNIFWGGNEQAQKYQEWTTAWSDSLNTGENNYELLSSVSLVGLLLLLFCKPSIKGNVSDIGIHSIRTGVQGLAGNKGAVLMGFRFRGDDFCIINTHLRSGSKASDAAARKREISQVIRDSFVNEGHCMEFQHVFLIGDFNSRKQGSSATEVPDLAAENGRPSLLASDELAMRSLAEGEWFLFKEGKVSFPPTYKVVPFTQESDIQLLPAFFLV